MRDINVLQTMLFLFVKQWANIQKTPIPQKEIITYATSQKVKSYTALGAINALLLKGYLRRAYSEKANRTYYVMTRNI